MHTKWLAMATMLAGLGVAGANAQAAPAANFGDMKASATEHANVQQAHYYRRHYGYYGHRHYGYYYGYGHRHQGYWRHRGW
jgi:hypothetical protein